MMDWIELKGLAARMWISKDALHIYAAFVIQVGAAGLTRRTLGNWMPWACVLAAELVNEFLDVWLGDEITIQEWQVRGAEHDILNTMVLPTALLLLCRYAAPLFHSPSAASGSGSRDLPVASDG